MSGRLLHGSSRRPRPAARKPRQRGALSSTHHQRVSFLGVLISSGASRGRPITCISALHSARFSSCNAHAQHTQGDALAQKAQSEMSESACKFARPAGCPWYPCGVALWRACAHSNQVHSEKSPNAPTGQESIEYGQISMQEGSAGGARPSLCLAATRSLRQ